jgi:PKD repeat protein
MTVFVLGSLDGSAVGQPAGPEDLTPELPDLLDGPAPVDDAMVDIPTTVSIVQRNADLGFDRLGEVLEDPTAWADREGRIFIVEPATHPALREDGLGELDDPPYAEGATAQSPGVDPVLADTYPHSMAFELESRPGSSRVIYLDFDGETISGTAWNANFNSGADFYAAPYDTDASPNTFSDAERAVIQGVWRRVAEDFAPFDVNVTTKDPGQAAIERSGSADQQYGTTVLISNTTTIYSSCGCGGVAYIGVFDLTSPHSYYQPAWVFQRGVGSGAKGIAEAASHEAGHNLGLVHDGQGAQDYYFGHGSWAPIMGVGYNQPITQWSQGEYSGATNAENDYTVMQQNGLPLLTDDHANTTGAASSLGTGAVDATGIISTPTDVDVFAVSTTGGTVSFAASPATVSPNLDIALELVDEEGNVVAASDPASARTNNDVATGLGASMSVDLAAGHYYLRVDGTAAGDPLGTGYTDYGSLGRYRITGTIPNDGSPVPAPPSAAIDVAATSGTAPLAVVLDGSASTDPDGTIVGYSWDLGDSSGATGPVVSHTYTSPGVFTVTLTVTDDTGLTATSSATITVGAPPQPEPRSDPDPSVDVVDVAVSGSTPRSGATARAGVRVADVDGLPVGGVTITGIFSLTALDGTTRTLVTAAGTTGADGTLTVTSPTVADTLRNEVFSFCVLAVDPPAGMTHDQALSSAPTCGTWAHDRVPVFCRGRLATIVGSGAIRGTAGSDVIVGSGRSDVIRGLGGGDVICGGGGNDVVFGNGGNDRLHGDGGRDRLVGGPGRDRLDGGRGLDQLVTDRSDVLVRSRPDRIVLRARLR